VVLFNESDEGEIVALPALAQVDVTLTVTGFELLAEDN
jgi:hypothetical protein